jgi:outer membrane protein assembly factor BamB
VRWRHRWDNDTGGTQVLGAVSSGDLVVAAVEHPIDWEPTVEVVAFDRSTGDTRWTTRLARSVMPRPALAGGRVFVTSAENPLTGLANTVRALDLRTGAVL